MRQLPGTYLKGKRRYINFDFNLMQTQCITIQSERTRVTAAYEMVSPPFGITLELHITVLKLPYDYRHKSQPWCNKATLVNWHVSGLKILQTKLANLIFLCFIIEAWKTRNITKTTKIR